jgi:endonuclease-3
MPRPVTGQKAVSRARPRASGPAKGSETAPEPVLKVVRARARRVYDRLLALYGLPEWRHPLPAVDELVSTILSQNTSDINRDRAFTRLRARFPDWAEAVRAPVEDIIALIRPAGLANLKAPRIQQILRLILEERGELNLDFLREWPVEEARAWLTKFNGVGPKTASIVLLFSLGRPAFPVDTHVHRVTGRLGLRPAKLSAEKCHAYFEAVFAPETFGAAHLNLIRHGREVCHARRPDCAGCGLKRLCPYYRTVWLRSNS